VNWLLKVAICVATALTVALVSTVSANILKIKISGSMGAKITYCVATTLWGWCLFVVYLELSGAKITWPN